MSILKLIIVCAVILILYSCPSPYDDVKTIYISPISDSILNFIPYQTGNNVVFEHSEGSA